MTRPELRIWLAAERWLRSLRIAPYAPPLRRYATPEQLREREDERFMGDDTRVRPRLYPRTWVEPRVYRGRRVPRAPTSDEQAADPARGLGKCPVGIRGVTQDWFHVVV